MYEKDSVREACYQEFRLGMKARACDVGVILVEVKTLSDSPREVFVVIFVCSLWRIEAQHVLPHEESTVLAHCVYGFLVRAKPSTHDGLLMR